MPPPSVTSFCFLRCATNKLAGEKALTALDNIRTGQILAWLFNPIRNISAVAGLYVAFKIEYFIVHSDKAPTAESWGRLLWELITKL